MLCELKTASRINLAGIGSDSTQTTESHVTSHIDFITSLAVMPYKCSVIHQFNISSRECLKGISSTLFKALS